MTEIGLDLGELGKREGFRKVRSFEVFSLMNFGGMLFYDGGS